MGADASWPLQQGLLDHLKNCKSIRKYLGTPPRILTQGEKSGNYPELVMGDSTVKAWSSATFDGQEHRLCFDLWTSGGGSAEAKKVAGAVIDRLHDADFPVPGHALVDLQFASSETRYLEEEGVFLTRLAFTALTVSD